MNVLVFEWMVGGGSWHEGEPLDPDCHFFRQGYSMFECVVKDLQKIGCCVSTTVDSRYPIQIEVDSVSVTCRDELKPALLELASAADAILLIAPESGGILKQLLIWLSTYASKLISPNLDFVTLASSKQLTCQHLLAHGIGVPEGFFISDQDHSIDIFTSLELPCVAKPDDGAGSDQISRIEDWAKYKVPTTGVWRIERLVPGKSVSVSVVSNEGTVTVLTPTEQAFDRPLGHYVTAVAIQDPMLVDRAASLAIQAANVLPTTVGYFGIDMIIGDDDVVVDVNPRLTASYCRLREIEDFNIAQLMLEPFQNQS